MDFLKQLGYTDQDIIDIKNYNYDYIVENIIINKENVESIIEYLLSIGIERSTIKEIFMYQVGLFFKTFDEIKTSFDEYEIDSIVKSLNYDVNNIEYIQSTGEYITHLFFCDPHMSCQKGMIEKNHEFIRYILPKGSSFKTITQEDCNLFANNINSLCRDSLNGKSPYEAMLFLCDESILEVLNCSYIKPDEVILNDSLLKY